MNEILEFLRKLKANNNREWFNENKAEYESAKKSFDKIVDALILKIGEVDKPILNVSSKECVFRIYRDIRFSHYKTPYKTHFGAYIAFPGGRKSQRGGYYLHIDPVDGCFFSAGIWSPEPTVLKALRQSIFDNIEEFNEIRNKAEFKKYYGNSFYQEDKLKSLPAGFPKDFSDPEILKLKHYLVTHDLTNEDVLKPDFIDFLGKLAKIAYPMNEFLNFTVDEL